MRALLVALVLSLPSAPASALDRNERGEIEDVVRNYLVRNPEVIEDALKELGRRRQAEAEVRRREVLERRGGEPETGARGVLGAIDGDVTLVEFFDYNCGYCRKAIKTIDALIEADPRLKVVVYDLPVIRQESVGAAEVSIAVAALAPDRFRAFHEKLLAAQAVVTREKALEAAGELGLQPSAVAAAIANPDVRAALLDAKQFATELGVEATPTFVVGDAVVVNSSDVVEQLRSKIAAMRACGKSSCG